VLPFCAASVPLLGERRSSDRIAAPACSGLRCVYRSVTNRLECPASFWIVCAATPSIARWEQKVCRRTRQPISLRPARRQTPSSRRSACFWVHRVPSISQNTNGPRRCRISRSASSSRAVRSRVLVRPPLGPTRDANRGRPARRPGWREMVLVLVSDAVFQNPGQPGRVDGLQQVVREPCLAAAPGVVVPPVARQRDEHRVLGCRELAESLRQLIPVHDG